MPFSGPVNRYSRLEAGRVTLHHHEILLHSVLAIEIALLASAMFRVIPGGQPAGTLPCAMQVTASGVERGRWRQPNRAPGGARLSGNGKGSRVSSLLFR